ncbi:MAG: hypothetical protein OEL76_17155 [Siculibacillus sp.]|nr:hypothetical protein [Siculibacillus sp.]
MRVLLGWELGGNSGHLRRLGDIASCLVARGHEVHLALQRPTTIRLPAAWRDRIDLWQAPVWPGLWRSDGTRPLGEARAFGDVLANLGLQSADVFRGLLRAWDGILAAVRPDAVVANFAPALVAGARGRIARIVVGTGFTVPPTDGPVFPLFPGEEAPRLVAEEALLALVNRAMAGLGRSPLGRLPELFAAEAELPAVFHELDPHAAHRHEEPLPPFLPADLDAGAEKPPAPGRAEAVFAYLPASGLPLGAIDLLVALSRRMRVGAVVPGLDRDRAAQLVAAGVALSEHPRDWPGIRRDHGFMLCAGGMGTVSSALVTGLDLAILPGGIEQRLTARAAAAAGLGLDLGAMREPPERLADIIAARAADADRRGAVRERARSFRARAGDPASVVASRIDAMLRRNS